MPQNPRPRFHGLFDEPRSAAGIAALYAAKRPVPFDKELSVRFSLHQHPFVATLISRLISGSIEGLQGADTARLPSEGLFSAAQYAPADAVERPYPVTSLDFSSSGAYAVYNWELFFHVPLTIAIHLSKNQRFAEARRWFHYIFDPTDDSDGPTPERFWKVRPFQTTDVARIEEILINLATGADRELQEETINSIEAWKDEPFRPHLVARYRHEAYMLKTVMAYLDNLIAWGDALFRQDTRESINEALQFYVLASNLLGPRPDVVPEKRPARPQTYADLRGQLDPLSNALTEVETEIPFDAMPRPWTRPASARPGRHGRMNALRSVALHFCIPPNDRLLAYWDTVADRLFKIRNSLNIEGIFRQLPLFEPPIDPALLAKAAAAGVPISDVVNGAQPLPLVRFRVLVRHALEICQEVRLLGANLLAAMEKEDNEALAILRARHERVMLELVESVRYAEWQEAIKVREGVERSIEAARERHAHYLQLMTAIHLGIPEPDPLDVDRLFGMSFRSEEPRVGVTPVQVDVPEFAEEHEGKALSANESEEMQKLKEAQGAEASAAIQEKLGTVLSLIPDFSLNAQPFGIGLSIAMGGGSTLAKMLAFTASFDRSRASELTYEAGKAARIGAYDRREQDWTLQANLAAREISQLYKQLRAAQIREAIASRALTNHRKQMEQAEEIEAFLTDEKNGKTTNQAFYAWMKREVRGLYAACFQLAFDAARKAERALGHELGDPSLSLLSLGYLAGKEGLFAGEKLYLDIKRMELAYLDMNQRELELTKHVSLRQVDPRALLELRATGSCEVELPESLFDMDGPGHYFRRIRTVAVSVPSVTGPYTSVNLTLTLLRSSIRKSPLLADQEDPYARTGENDPRFSDNASSLQSIVTSTAQADSGLFEVNLQDDRYLPFEGSGVISRWRLELPAEVPQFDLDTISDVILHIRYTARPAGGQLREGAVAHLKQLIADASAAGSVQLLSVRQEFPVAWARFKAAEPTRARAELTLELREEHYPFWSGASSETPNITLHAVTLFARGGEPEVTVHSAADGSGASDELTEDESLGGLRVGTLDEIPLPPPFGAFSLYLDDNSMDELWIAVSWGANI